MTQVQLIDANIQRGEDATAVGKFEEDPASAITSNGRLPTSPWISWSPDPGVEAIATLSGSETKGKDV